MKAIVSAKVSQDFLNLLSSILLCKYNFFQKRDLDLNLDSVLTSFLFLLLRTIEEYLLKIGLV